MEPQLAQVWRAVGGPRMAGTAVLDQAVDFDEMTSSAFLSDFNHQQPLQNVID